MQESLRQSVRKQEILKKVLLLQLEILSEKAFRSSTLSKGNVNQIVIDLNSQ